MKEAITRLVLAVIFFVNAVLLEKGINPLPLNENAVTEFISLAFAGGSILWAWWKNNNVTPEAREAQKLLDRLKAEKEV